MIRSAQWLAVVGSATLGLAGCQAMSSSTNLSWKGDPGASVVRAAEPDDPASSIPSLQLHAVETSTPHARGKTLDDPFAPITVEQLLPASHQGPAHSAPAGETTTATGYMAPPAAISSTTNTLMPPVPMAVTYPTIGSPSPLAAGAGHWDAGAALHGSCPTCGTKGGSATGILSGMTQNMVIFSGADYFQNSGMINSDRLFNAANILNVEPVDVPNFDPARLGGMFGINAGAPFTSDGKIGFQIGGLYIESEDGAQGFFTTGLFHRCDTCENCGVNWGAVFDIAYDDHIDYVIGQIRIKAGYALSPRDEIGGWFTIGTNVEQVDVTVTTRILGTTGPIFEDTFIRARVRPECHGFFFWRHVLTCGAETSIFTGVRENLGGAFVLGYTAQVPFTDCWSIMSGGHWSNDSGDRGSWDVYLGVGLYPGGNARSTGSCGNRFLPYQDVANNTFMPMSINPRFLQVVGDRAGL